MLSLRVGATAKRMKKLLLFLFFILPVLAKGQTPSIHFSPYIRDDQKRSLLKDLDHLLNLPVEANNAKANALFETPQLTTSHLNAWLAERAHFFVEQGFDSSSKIQIIQENFTYPNSILPQTERATKQTGIPNNGQTVQIMMSNRGVSLYYMAKAQNQKQAISIPGYGLVPLTSPHIGLFMIGEGLFNQMISDSYSIDSMANSLLRMKTYFHEARHTDGNGTSLGFFHVVCPLGHQYEGYSACDKNSNGPYQVATQFLSATINSCKQCSSGEKEALRNVQLDSQLRIVNQSLNEKYIPIKRSQNPKTEAPELSLSSTCQALKDQGADLTQIESCKRPDTPNILAPVGSDEPPIWDPTPESTGEI